MPQKVSSQPIAAFLKMRKGTLSIVHLFFLFQLTFSKCIRKQNKVMVDHQPQSTTTITSSTTALTEPPFIVHQKNAQDVANVQQAFSSKPLITIAAPPQSEPPKPNRLNAWGNECLVQHNFHRSSSETLDKNPINPLVWDADLASDAQKWASFLASKNNGLVHSNFGHGENLFSDTQKSNDCKTAVDAWFNEYPLYGNQKIGYGNFDGYGHFTQLVWPNTTKLGCAFADSSNWRYVVCEYDPR
jgi:uncharacterized protein YkwD